MKVFSRLSGEHGSAGRYTLKLVLRMALCAVFALALCACGADDEVGEEPAALTSGVGSYDGFRATTLYYLSDDGFVVPMMKYIPWEEGIGKAALGCLVDSPDNSAGASVLGLNTVIPAGTEYSLRIADDKTATLDLVNLSACPDRASESAMVQAIVNTLAEFPTIDTVRITVNGRSDVTLPHGTVLSGAMAPFSLNAEDGELEASTGEGAAMTLYFPNLTASLNVPVTRFIQGQANAETAVRALIEGPASGALLSCFPEGTQVLGVTVDEGAATVDLSAEFMNAGLTEGLDIAAYETLMLTLNCIEAVTRLDITVEGEPYEMSVETSAPLYANVFGR